MKAQYLIGIDLGTQSTKSMVFDTLGTELGAASQDIALQTPKPGWVVQDPDEIYRSALETVRRAVAQAQIDPKDVAGISLDAQIPTMVRIDADWQALGPAESYLDTRNKPQRDAMMKAHGSRIMELQGMYPYFAPKLAWWKENEPDQYQRTIKAVTLNTYIGGRLAGLKAEQAYVDPSHMCIYGWADMRTFTWSSELVERLEINMEQAPRPVPPWEVVGALTTEAAEATGLRAGIPIAAGLGDAVAGWLGVGLVEPGNMVDTSGTANHVGFCTESFNPDHRHGVLTFYPSAIPGLWHPIGYTAGTGRSHSWYVDELCGGSIAGSNGSGSKKEIYARLEAAAAAIPPGSEGLVFSPHFGGRVCPDQPGIRGFWLGLTWKHTQAHLYRSILESIAFEYYCYLKVARELFPDQPFTRVVTIGGGAKSPLWTQLKADILGIPHAVCANRSDFAPLGSAIIAGHAVGLFPDMAQTARQFTEVAQPVQPIAENQKAYRPYAEFYYNLFQRLEPIFDELLEIANQP